MSEPAKSAAVTYGSYLHVDELLSLQQPRSAGPEHDEMLFIVIHQVYELWFKQLLHEFDRVTQLLTADDTHRVQHTLKRILTILKVMVAQLDILETMTPLEFLSFRERLEAASGFQSDQFRQIEFILGVKSRQGDRAVSGGQPRPRRARTALRRTDDVGRLPQVSRARGLPLPRGAPGARCRRRVEPAPEIQDILSRCTAATRRMPSCASGSSTSTKASRSGGIVT